MHSFLLHNLLIAVPRIIKKFFFQPSVHHHSSPDSVKWVNQKLWSHCNNLSKEILLPKVKFFEVGYQILSSVIKPKKHSSVKKDWRHGNSQSLIHPSHSARFQSMGKAMQNSIILSCPFLSHIDTQSSSCEFQWVDKEHATTTCHSTSHHISKQNSLVGFSQRRVLKFSIKKILEGKI